MVIDHMDPFNSQTVWSREYEAKGIDIEKEFSDQFALHAFIESRSVGPMHGRDYPRAVLSFIFGNKH